MFGLLSALLCDCVRVEQWHKCDEQSERVQAKRAREMGSQLSKMSAGSG